MRSVGLASYAGMPDDLPIHIHDVPSPRREFGEIAAARRRLGFAAGAKRLGVALIEIDPGKRSTPPHSHADEDELFLVLAGSGLELSDFGLARRPHVPDRRRRPALAPGWR